MFSKLLTFTIVALALGAVDTLAATVAPPAVTGTVTEYAPGPVATAGIHVNSTDLVPGADGQLLLCVNLDFTGSCTNALYLGNTCTNVPVGFQDNVSSVKPAVGVTCTLYKDENCGGTNIIAITPGYSNLKDQGFNDVLTSFQCS